MSRSLTVPEWQNCGCEADRNSKKGIPPEAIEIKHCHSQMRVRQRVSVHSLSLVRLVGGGVDYGDPFILPVTDGHLYRL